MLVFALCWVSYALASPSDPTTLNKKIMVGYQGWHSTASDGAGIEWTHWSNDGSQVPGPATVHVDAFPALTEYPANVLAPVNFSFHNGTVAKLFSSQYLDTTLLHFKWMADYHIHGAFVQRFLQGLDSPAILAARTRVANHARTAAELYGRVFALEYDVSGVADAALLPTLTNDWDQVVSNLTTSPAYLHHGGKPVVIVWGLGFSDSGHPATPATATLIQDFFEARNVTLIGGVPTYWRTLRNDARADPAWTPIYLRFAFLHPWLVGRFPDDAGADSELAENILPDLQLCQEHGVGYLPVVWPGFSWANMHGGTTPLNMIPRRSGTFLYHQLDNVLRRANITAVFGAMFDELDEGTAMMKIAATREELPAQGQFIYAGIDGEAVRGDWWLYLLGVAADALGGVAPWPGSLRPALPTPLTEEQAGLGFAGLLGRAPLDFELVSAASTLATGGGGGGGDLAAWCQGLVGSPEFQRHGLTPPLLAVQLYKGCLGVAPNAAEVADLVKDIEGGRTAQRAAQLITCGIAGEIPCPEKGQG